MRNIINYLFRLRLRCKRAVLVQTAPALRQGWHWKDRRQHAMWLRLLLNKLPLLEYCTHLARSSATPDPASTCIGHTAEDQQLRCWRWRYQELSPSTAVTGDESVPFLSKFTISSSKRYLPDLTLVHGPLARGRRPGSDVGCHPVQNFVEQQSSRTSHTVGCPIKGLGFSCSCV